MVGVVGGVCKPGKPAAEAGLPEEAVRHGEPLDGVRVGTVASGRGDDRQLDVSAGLACSCRELEAEGVLSVGALRVVGRLIVSASAIIAFISALYTV